jgi:hypothetical protein
LNFYVSKMHSDLVRLIFNQLPTNALLKARLACKHWYACSLEVLGLRVWNTPSNGVESALNHLLAALVYDVNFTIHELNSRTAWVSRLDPYSDITLRKGYIQMKGVTFGLRLYPRRVSPRPIVCEYIRSRTANVICQQIMSLMVCGLNFDYAWIEISKVCLQTYYSWTATLNIPMKLPSRCSEAWSALMQLMRYDEFRNSEPLLRIILQFFQYKHVDHFINSKLIDEAINKFGFTRDLLKLLIEKKGYDETLRLVKLFRQNSDKPLRACLKHATYDQLRPEQIAELKKLKAVVYRVGTKYSTN